MTLSPSDLIQETILPSVMVELRAGMKISLIFDRTAVGVWRADPSSSPTAGGGGAMHERPVRGVGWGGGGGVCLCYVRERTEGGGCCEFWKMVYGKFFRKSFSSFL